MKNLKGVEILREQLDNTNILLNSEQWDVSELEQAVVSLTASVGVMIDNNDNFCDESSMEEAFQKRMEQFQTRLDAESGGGQL